MQQFYAVERDWGSNKISTYVRHKLQDAISEANEHLDVCMWDGDYAYEYICGKLTADEDYGKADTNSPHAWCDYGNGCWTADIFPIPKSSPSYMFVLCIYSDEDMLKPLFFASKGAAISTANSMLKEYLETNDIFGRCPKDATRTANDNHGIPQASCHWHDLNWDAFVLPV